ncbi:hypothetical protein AR438_10990 [Chryseobacterium aquaticum]|uniref:Peptidase M41 domain-containing protein n=1 Tax=Chryseobacterium aquaticum TaxID=452084 RepID=A0A0Q3K8Y9_9FLAO|nr:hypothetical protein [Chryseobacterium aquaticum]KQK26099.1 hypothetical protein AR438_10990 [Chryseobacterium aquaticum]
MTFIEKNIDEIRKIFFHELGHFIAYKFSSKDIEGFKIGEIKITKCPPCKNGFGGHITPILPADFDNKSRLSPERLAHSFTNNYFGCIFQILLTDSEQHLELCMQDYGQLDQRKVNDNLMSYQLISKTYDIADHFYGLCDNLRKENFDTLKNLDLEKLLSDTNEEISVNIDYLEKDSHSFIDSFHEIYHKQLKVLTEIISLKR